MTLGKQLVFFYSFFNDNPQKNAIFHEKTVNGTLQYSRIAMVSEAGNVNYNDWATGQLGKLDESYILKPPKTSNGLPGFFNLQLQYTATVSNLLHTNIHFYCMYPSLYPYIYYSLRLSLFQYLRSPFLHGCLHKIRIMMEF